MGRIGLLDEQLRSGGVQVLRVIGVGFGRTGTSSLKAALEILGLGPCHHMSELFRDPGKVNDWLRAATGGPADWQRLLSGYRSAVDWPSVYFWRELVEKFPEAKVVLTVREPDRWYESVMSKLYGARYGRIEEMPPDIRERFESVPGLRAQPELVEEVIWQGTFKGRFENRRHAIATYLEHVEQVKAHVAAERLLTFDVTEGWPPLCEFLDVSAPLQGFPRIDTVRT